MHLSAVTWLWALGFLGLASAENRLCRCTAWGQIQENPTKDACRSAMGCSKGDLCSFYGNGRCSGTGR